MAGDDHPPVELPGYIVDYSDRFVAVFNVEQGIPEETCREGNRRATHVLVFDDEQPVATGRLVIDAGSCAELARIAVLKSHRGRGVGGKVVVALEEGGRIISALGGSSQHGGMINEHILSSGGQPGHGMSGRR